MLAKPKQASVSLSLCFSSHDLIITQRNTPVLTLFHISHCDVIVDRRGSDVTIGIIARCVSLTREYRLGMLVESLTLSSGPTLI